MLLIGQGSVSAIDKDEADLTIANEILRESKDPGSLAPAELVTALKVP